MGFILQSVHWFKIFSAMKNVEVQPANWTSVIIVTIAAIVGTIGYFAPIKPLLWSGATICLLLLLFNLSIGELKDGSISMCVACFALSYLLTRNILETIALGSCFYYIAAICILVPGGRISGFEVFLSLAIAIVGVVSAIFVQTLVMVPAGAYCMARIIFSVFRGGFTIINEFLLSVGLLIGWWLIKKFYPGISYATMTLYVMLLGCSCFYAIGLVYGVIMIIIHNSRNP